MNSIIDKTNNILCRAQYILDKYPDDPSIQRWVDELRRDAKAIENQAKVLADVFTLLRVEPPKK